MKQFMQALVNHALIITFPIWGYAVVIVMIVTKDADAGKVKDLMTGRISFDGLY